MTGLGGITSAGFRFQISASVEVAFEDGNVVICGNDPVNGHDPLGLADLSPARLKSGIAAVIDQFTTPAPGGARRIVFPRQFADLDELRIAVRRTFINAAEMGRFYASDLYDAHDAADQLWAASSCAFQAAWENDQKVQRVQGVLAREEAKQRAKQNAAYVETTGNFLKPLGYGCRLGGHRSRVAQPM